MVWFPYGYKSQVILGLVGYLLRKIHPPRRGSFCTTTRSRTTQISGRPRSHTDLGLHLRSSSSSTPVGPSVLPLKRKSSFSLKDFPRVFHSCFDRRNPSDHVIRSTVSDFRLHRRTTVPSPPVWTLYKSFILLVFYPDSLLSFTGSQTSNGGLVLSLKSFSS